MMQLAASRPTGVQLQGSDALPTLVGNDIMGFNGAGGVAAAGAGMLLIGAALSVGLNWWAFKASRDGSNIKPALIMSAPGVLMAIFGSLALGAAASAAP